MITRDFSGQTFVAFIDISGFKELMRVEGRALDALDEFYQSGYDTLHDAPSVEGVFVSDCGVLFVREGNPENRLSDILRVVKGINRRMLDREHMLTTSIAYGDFNFRGKLEFERLSKNPIFGNAYIKAFLDNEKGSPRIQPGQCRVLADNIPFQIEDLQNFPLQENLNLLVKKNRHYYYYWNVDHQDQVEAFEARYNDTYKLKYAGMLESLKMIR